MNKNLKKFISSIAALSMVAGLAVAPVSASNFSDVADTAEYKQAFDELFALGIFTGYEDGTVKPEANITRAEVTKLVVAAMGPSYTEAALGAANIDTQFTDVPGSHWAAGYVATGVANSFINGMDATTFAPEENVTYAQIVKMIVAAMGYTSICERNGGYPNGYLTTASSIGVTKGVNIVGADTVVTRGQVAMLLDNAINIPIVGITGYEESATTGQLIAKTAIMDEITQYGDAKNYKTLLTENHDAYKVKGRISATPKSLDSLDNGEVKFVVEATNNFDGFAYGGAYTYGANNESWTTQTMLYDGADAESLLFTYAEAVITETSDSDYVILSITPYGSNDIVETEASLYESGSVKADEISFYVDADSSKTKKYDVADDVKVYVNGVPVKDVIEESGKDDKGNTIYKTVYSWVDKVEEFIGGNDSGKVTLIDATETGKTTTDGEIDYVLIDYYVDAIIDSVADGSEYKIYFKNSHANVKTMKIDTEDEDKTATYVLDGEEIAHTDLLADDVVSIAYDVTGSFVDSDFYEVIVSRETVTGKVSSTGEDNNENPYFVINDTNYSASKLGPVAGDTLTPGNEYILYVNAFGKFVHYDEDTASKNIGIFDKASIDSSDTPKIRIITAAGTKVSYSVKDSSKTKYNEIKDKFYTNGVLNPVEQLLCEYTINSNGYITSATPITAEYAKVGATDALDMTTEWEYKEATTKLGKYTLSESTIVIDLSDKQNVKKHVWGKDDKGNDVITNEYSISKVSAKTVADLADGSEYAALFAEKANSDGSFRYVVLLSGGATYTADTAIAVFDKAGSAYDDIQGTSVTTLEVYENGEDEAVALKVAPGVKVDDLTRGDVFIYEVDSDGYIDSFVEIFGAAHATTYTGFMDTMTPDNLKYDTQGSKDVPVLATMPADWAATDSSTKSGEVDLIYGVITEKKNSNVSVGVVTALDADAKDKDANVIKAGTYVVDKATAEDYTLTGDANVYVYDYSEIKEGNRLYAGNASSVIRSMIPDSELLDVDGDGNIDEAFTLKEDGAYREINFIFAKLVDGDIAEALVILGANK